MKNIIMWGASDQARVDYPVIKEAGYNLVALFDDTPDKESPFPDVPLYKGKEGFYSWKEKNIPAKFIVAVGNPCGKERCEIARFLIDEGYKPFNLINKTAYIDSSAKIGDGIQVMPHAVIHNDAIIGEQCIINTRALVEHDCILHEGVELSPGVTLCGRITIGKNTWICAGSIIAPRLTIGKNSVVGAGAVVLKDVPDNTLVAGVPAKFIRNT